jgi:heme exporter protein A
MRTAEHLPVRRLTAEKLACVRGERQLFTGLDLMLGPGDALLLTGPNGAGKSSLLMCLAGLLAHEGQVIWHGRNSEERPGSDLHFFSHLPAVKPHLSLRHNLEFWADLNRGDRTRIGPALSEARLDHAADLAAGLLSAGQTRRLALCRLLVAPRPIWLLDEPTAALDTQGDKWVAGLIDRHLATGGLAVIATHLKLKLSRGVRTLALAVAS